MFNLFLLILLILLWIYIFWYIFFRIGLFKKSLSPKFSIKFNNKLYKSKSSKYLVSGIENKFEVIHLFSNEENIPFVYSEKNNCISLFKSKDDFLELIKNNCGGEKVLKKINIQDLKFGKN
ncbi:hypothetical protein OAK17_00575 [Alphaproteobacteria bacterium]|nr:hypothetical protein [Alphaproteobacteria bacterium]